VGGKMTEAVDRVFMAVRVLRDPLVPGSSAKHHRPPTVRLKPDTTSIRGAGPVRLKPDTTSISGAGPVRLKPDTTSIRGAGRSGDKPSKAVPAGGG
jgi:hypothetical protein